MKIEYFGNAKEENLTLQEAPYFSNIVRVGWPSPADDYVERSIDLNEYLIKNPEKIKKYQNLAWKKYLFDQKKV